MGPDWARCARWAMREHLRAELVCTALLMAAQRQQPAKGLVAHSDRGSQYAAGLYRALLEGWGMQQSMGRKGCCYDNALASRACWPGFLRKRIDRSASSGELLPRTQGRARSSGTLRQPRGGPARAVRLSRGLLQSPAAPLGSRLSHARACRAARRLTPCPPNQGKINIPILGLTDGPLSPLLPLARIAFEVEDAELQGFRSLSATMCLALTLIVRLGQTVEDKTRPRHATRRTAARSAR